MMSFKFQVSGFKFKVRRSLAGALCALFIVNCSLFIVNCSSYPVDDDGLLITEREECYVSSFGLSGVDRRTVLVGGSVMWRAFHRPTPVVPPESATRIFCVFFIAAPPFPVQQALLTIHTGVPFEYWVYHNNSQAGREYLG